MGTSAPTSGLSGAVLAIPRNIDEMPIGGVELFGSAYGTVPNDGAYHQLQEPAGAHVQAPSNSWVRLAYARAEWSTIDLVIPPPLTLSVRVSGTISVQLLELANLILLPMCQGTPAIDVWTYAELAPGATVSVWVKNTGSVSQFVDVFFYGWSYPQSLPDGAGYQPQGSAA